MNTARATWCACFLLALVHCDAASTADPNSGSSQDPVGGATQAPVGGVTQAPGAVTTQAPGAVATQAPAGGPTQAPGGGPTQAPGGGPTQAPVAKVGENCTVGQIPNPCQDHSSCDSNTGKCAPDPGAVGGICTGNETESDCSDLDGSECKTGKCQCKSGYNNLKDSLTCTKNGSAAVFGSILVMAVAFLTTRLD